MTIARRLVFVVVLGASAAGDRRARSTRAAPSTALVVLGAGVVAGELLVLRPAERAPLPLSYAVILVLVRGASPAEFLVTVFAAEMVAYLFRPERSVGPRLAHRDPARRRDRALLGRTTASST